VALGADAFHTYISGSSSSGKLFLDDRSRSAERSSDILRELCGITGVIPISQRLFAEQRGSASCSSRVFCSPACVSTRVVGSGTGVCSGAPQLRTARFVGGDLRVVGCALNGEQGGCPHGGCCACTRAVQRAKR
jgi:hypothetical protein